MRTLKLSSFIFLFASLAWATTCPQTTANTFYQVLNEPFEFVRQMRIRAKVAAQLGKTNEFEVPEFSSPLAWIAKEVPSLADEAAALKARGIPYAPFVKLAFRASVALASKQKVPKDAVRVMAEHYVDHMLSVTPEGFVFPTEIDMPIEMLIQLSPYPIYPLGLITGPKPMNAFDYLYHDLGHAVYQAVALGNYRFDEITAREKNLREMAAKIDVINDAVAKRAVIVVLYELLHEPYRRNEVLSVLPYDAAKIRADLQPSVGRLQEMVDKRKEEGLVRQSREDLQRAFDWLLRNLP